MHLEMVLNLFSTSLLQRRKINANLSTFANYFVLIIIFIKKNVVFCQNTEGSLQCDLILNFFFS
jgi:hypothetical protein